MIKKQLYFLFICFLSIGLNAQTITLKGTVENSLQQPLTYANVIAKPTDSLKALKFAITDDFGYYKLELIKDNTYTISISYLGFKTENFQFEAKNNAQKNSVLSDAPNWLQEVIIELPVSVKEDTITYNTSKFITGEERKLKNVLKKLPGVEVSKNGDVLVQGKKITTLLVEGKKFFGGGTKLAVDNIPANAIDKVQVIENYNEIAFLKNVSGSDQLAMNIQLKKDKKEFVFGDVEVGKGSEDFYRTHSNLFYYSPKTTVNFIGNINNTGEKTFTYKNYFDFQGGVSSFLKDDSSRYNSSENDFSQFLEAQDLVESNNKFGALNITKTINSKLSIGGYAIFSHSKNKTFESSINNYSNFNEENELNSVNKTILGIAKLNLEYSPNANEKWYFKTQFKQIDNFIGNSIISNINSERRFIFSEADAVSSNFNQNIEWHKSLSSKHTFSFAADISFDKNNPNTLWQTNQQMLQGLIPIEEVDTYKILQTKKVNTDGFNVVSKHYWVLNNYNHLYTTLGYKYINETFFTNDRQQFENESENNFSSSGFGNDLKYNLNDLFVGVHYKFKAGIFEVKPGAFLHTYNWSLNKNEDLNKIVLLPDFNAKISFSNSKKIMMNYQLKTSFSESSKLVNQFYLQSYNAVYKGNDSLYNELFHHARIDYSRFSIYKGLMLFSSVDYTKKVKGIQNAIVFNESDQYISPIMVDNPEERGNLNLNLYKTIKNLKYGVSTTALISKYLQSINQSFFVNKNESIGYNLSVKTLYDNFPTIEIGYKQNSGNYTSSDQTSKYSIKEPYLNVDYDFFNSFIFSLEYSNYSYLNKTGNQTNNYQLANTTVSYKNENSAWSFKIDAQNLLDVKYKRQNSFSSYIISDTKTYILPRIIMFTVGYNL